MFDRVPSRSLWRLLQPLSTTPLVVDQQITLAVQFAAWAQLAATATIPVALAPSKTKLLTAEAVSRIFRELRGLPALGENGDAFAADDSQFQALSDGALGQLLQEARHLVEGGFIGPEFVEEVLIALSTGASRSGLVTLPSELVKLLIGLAEIKAGETVYAPFDEALQLSLAAAEAGAKVSTEMPRHSPLPYLINLLTDQQIHINAGRNPITHPSFTDGQRLSAFAKTLCFPPMGWRLPLETSTRDLYGRFPERTASGSVLAVRHVLAQTASRAVILAPNSLLFGAGAERSLRRDLVHGGLETVISLPPATLFGTAIPLAILVVNLQSARQPDILFVDGSAEPFFKRDGKGRTTLTGWQELLRIAGQRVAGDHAASVSKAVVAENDYQLMVARYARSDLSEAVDEALRDGEVVALEDLVEFIRPLPVNVGSDAADLPIEAAEVGVADLPEFGYIRNPRKHVRLAGLKNVLQPLDILIAVKGSVGKVGIVSPELAETWVAGQSCLILRMRGDQPQRVHSPHSLLLYLRSAVGKACLERITSGTTVPLIQLRELRKLTVLVPTQHEQAAAEQAFSQMVAFQEQIEAMREQQQLLATQFWPMPVTTDV
jgi:type I restriction enzyme M protein